jgi:hypothetical protein
MLGQLPDAFKTARQAFNAAPEASAPILPAVLLEMVPAARGKGHDEELAELLEEAIGKHMATVVDPGTVAGVAFLAARPHHVRNAWRTIIEIYAIRRSEEMLSDMRRL